MQARLTDGVCKLAHLGRRVTHLEPGVQSQVLAACQEVHEGILLWAEAPPSMRLR